MKQTLQLLSKTALLIAILGVLNIRGGKAQTFNFQNWNKDSNATFTVNAFRSVTVDKRGTVWVGSDLGGLYRFNDTIWKKINTYPDVTFRHMVPSNIAGDSNVWATSIGKSGVQATTGGAYLIDTKAEMVTQYGSGIAGGLGSRYANSLALSSRGMAYVALAQSLTGSTTNQGGVYKILTVNPPVPSTTSFIKAILNDAGDIIYHSAGNRGDELWFGRGANCSGGCQAPYIARMNSNGLILPSITASNSPLPFTNASTSSFPRAIFTDTTTGNTFVGLNSGGIGVCKPNGGWKMLTDANSPLPAGAAVNFNAIADVFGEIWIGTTFGVFVYNGTGSLDSMSSFKMLTTANGFPSNSITDIAVDTARSFIWITSPVGVSRCPYTPPFIKGIVYNVFCNRPESSLDSLKLYDMLQKQPMVTGVKVKLFENGVIKDSSSTNADGVFELKNSEDGKVYRVEIKYTKDGKEITYQYLNIKNHTLMGSILIPDGLIGEIKAFKTKMQRRYFKLKLPFLPNGVAAYRDGFNVTEYDQAYEPFYNINGIQADHKRKVDNLADFYVSLATVYSLGGISTDLMNESVENAFDAIESLLAFVKFSKVGVIKERSELLKDFNLSIINVLKEGTIVLLNEGSAMLTANPEAKKIFDGIITIVNDAADLAINILDDTEEAGPKLGVDMIKKYMALQIAASYYKTYCLERHEKFILNAAISSKNAYSNFPYDQTYNQLFSPFGNSINKNANDAQDLKMGQIENYKNIAKVGKLAADVLDAATALALVPGGQLAAAIAKGLALSAKAVTTSALTAAMLEGVEGCVQVATLSDQILPSSGFTNNKRPINGYNRVKSPPSQLSPANLLIRKDSYNQKLTELKAIYNAPGYDSVVYFAKYKELGKEDSLYTNEMTKTLNALWASADSAVILVPGFTNKLSKVVDSFVSKQYTFRNSFYYQNIAYIFDTDKTSYTTELNNLANEIIILNDSAIKGIGYLVDEINTNGIAAPAYLVQDNFVINHSHLPGSNGTITYTFKNYGTVPQQNVSFKISAPTGGYTYLSPDSIYTGTIMAGESKEISFSFTAPLTDSICRYIIDVNATNGSFKDVSGSLYVNDPAKYYSVKDGNWSDPTTWSTNAVPTNTSDVVISNIVTVDVDANCKSINAVISGNIKINTGKHLNIVQ